MQKALAQPIDSEEEYSEDEGFDEEVQDGVDLQQDNGNSESASQILSGPIADVAVFSSIPNSTSHCSEILPSGVSQKHKSPITPSEKKTSNPEPGPKVDMADKS